MGFTAPAGQQFCNHTVPDIALPRAGHSAPGWRHISFKAQIVALYKLTISMTLKAFLTEMFSFMSISFTDYKQLLTPDISLY